MTPVAAVPQQVELRIYRDGKRIRTRARRGAAGRHVRAPLPTRRKGRISVRAAHVATPELGRGARAEGGRRTCVEPRAARAASAARSCGCSSAASTRLRYAVPRNDHYDAATGRAVMAFRKVNGMARRYDADRARDREGARRAGARSRCATRTPGRHVEADISRQVLALIEGGKVVDDVPHVHRRARDADDHRQLPRLPQGPGDERARAWSTRPTSSAATRSTATSTCPRSTPATAACACRSRTPGGSSRWLRHGDRVITYP